MSHPNGLHHITAVAGNPQQNLNFYTGLLGLRLVKKTVNFDDPSTYHLFYGDSNGSPGSIISFFCDKHFSQGEPEVGKGIAVSFSIPASSIDFWVNYLDEEDIDFIDPFERFGKPVIGFQDPDGLFLELVGSPAVDDLQGITTGSIPPEYAIRGLHGITLAEENYRATGQLLQESLGFEEVAEEHDRILYQSDARTGNTVEVVDGAQLDGKPGKGTIHHIAFRTKDEESQQKSMQNLKEVGYQLTEIEDRRYFSSFFFHEPGGALIEVATDGPGFTVDENSEQLGHTLCLPPNLDDKRSLIEAELPEIER